MTDDPDAGIPAGYVRLAAPSGRAVGLAELATPLTAALQVGSFYEFAARHPDARALAGRGIAYAVSLPRDAARVVVRHSRHGGLFAPLTGDRFVHPTRAPRELDIALRLTQNRVPTPEVVAFAVYEVGGPIRRADVVTREGPDAIDLAAALGSDPSDDDRRALLAAGARLLAALTNAGARDPDLNVKNILVRRAPNGTVEAMVLDVDRVWFDKPGAPHVTERNLARLARSARKWRRKGALSLADTDMGWLAATAHALAGEHVPA